MCRYIKWNRIVPFDSRSELVHIFGIHVWHFGPRHEVRYAVEPFVYVFTVNDCRVYLKRTHTTAIPLNWCKMYFVNEYIPLLYRKIGVSFYERDAPSQQNPIKTNLHTEQWQQSRGTGLSRVLQCICTLVVNCGCLRMHSYLLQQFQ